MLRNRSRAAASSIARGIPSRTCTHGDDGRDVLGPEREPGPVVRGAVGEERDRLVPGEVVEAEHCIHRRQGKRRDAVHVLARDPERLATRREDLDGRARLDQPLGQLRRGIEDVLAVVEDEQQRLLADGIDECLQRGPAWFLPYLERRRDARGDELWIRERCQLDEPHARAGPVEERRSGLQGEPGLAHSARAGDRHDAGTVQQSAQLPELTLASHERRDLCRQVVGEARVLERTQGSELLDQPRCAHLEQSQRLGEVAEPVLTEVEQRHVRRQRRSYELGDGLGHQHLPAVCRPQHAREAIQHRADVVAVPRRELAGVHSHPNLDVRPVGPRLRSQSPLRGDRGCDRVGRRLEDGMERIADHLEDVPAVAFDRGAHELVMARERDAHRVWVVLPQTGAAFDVREQHGHGHRARVPRPHVHPLSLHHMLRECA